MRSALVVLLVACGSTGTWKGPRLAGRASDPTIVAPLDCVAPWARDRNSDRHNEILGQAIERMVGAGGAYPLANGRVCQELGAAQTPFGHMPDSRDAITALAAQAHAASVLVPVVQRTSSCGGESLAVRDEGGQKIGSIDTGRTVCDPYPTQFRIFLFDASGELLWAHWVKMDGQDQVDPDRVRGKVDELFAGVPAQVVARAHAEPTVVAAPAVAARPTTLPANAPAECVATWNQCSAYAPDLAQSCHAMVLNAASYMDRSYAPAACQQYGESMKASAAALKR